MEATDAAGTNERNDGLALGSGAKPGGSATHPVGEGEPDHRDDVVPQSPVAGKFQVTGPIQ